jgi:hypothetical protein
MKTPDLSTLTDEQILKLLTAADSVHVCRVVAEALLDPVDPEAAVIQFIAQHRGQIAANSASQKFYNGDSGDALIFRMCRGHSDAWPNSSHRTAAARRHAFNASDPGIDPVIEYRARAQAGGL